MKYDIIMRDNESENILYNSTDFSKLYNTLTEIGAIFSFDLGEINIVDDYNPIQISKINIDATELEFINGDLKNKTVIDLMQHQQAIRG